MFICIAARRRFMVFLTETFTTANKFSFFFRDKWISVWGSSYDLLPVLTWTCTAVLMLVKNVCFLWGRLNFHQHAAARVPWFWWRCMKLYVGYFTNIPKNFHQDISPTSLQPFVRPLTFASSSSSSRLQESRMVRDRMRSYEIVCSSSVDSTAKVKHQSPALYI